MKVTPAFVLTSIELDMRTLAFKYWSLFERLEFIAKKYWLLAKHLSGKKFELGTSTVRLRGETIYYDSPFGLATYQSMITRHNRLLNNAEATNIKTVIDCGANVGFYSKFVAAKYGKKTSISVLEPVPQVFECLVKNLASEKSAVPFNVAISDKNSKVSMKFDPNNSVTSKVTEDGPVQVNAVTLDSFCEANGIKHVDLLKVDTEGYEIHVLKGAQETLASTKYLAIELNFRHNDYTIANLMSNLIARGFDFQLLSFRCYSSKREGRADVMDCLLVNTKLPA